ncbi:BREX-1 system adenine-specific DNA-methyltransferase PglX [uncultured Megasphaera sp.]|uniref:BREX-1 system adenine-specific DNA-methyltransferase PglX n=1 Tax=uncultured Megasphaera sp. TaxID=165188 RepID=UPI00265CF29F|nr:BREX-1 system adenine-specific DNA-methyltransferase PglX [uncultured Megasphaera sp.]
MDKTAIKKFAIWARKKLIADSIYRARLLGITDKGIQAPLPQSTKDAQFFDIGLKEPSAITGDAITQRKNLVAVIQEKAKESTYPEAFSHIMEETAYTWFNRLIAIRFMEVNDCLSSRVLSSKTPEKIEPDLVTSPFDSDLTFSEDESRQIVDWKMNNQTDDLFRMLFLKECNALNEPLPMLFEKIADYTELLLTLSISDRDGVVWHLVHDIPEDDFRDQVQIIGWLYQYYNTEPKDKVFARKSSEKIKKEDIPAATQLFTPDWIVRYMVENSLGRLWIEGHPNEVLKGQWKYYLDEAEQEESVQEQLNQIHAEHSKLNLEDLTCLDPCCGSGHILVYMFDVLMQIYRSRGYRDRDAAISIVEHNLYGLDIDERAAQLAYFAVMMKARQYDRRFLSRGIQPHVYAIEESNGLSTWKAFSGSDFGQLTLDQTYIAQADALIDLFHDAKEYGSILKVEPTDYDNLQDYLEEIRQKGSENILFAAWADEMAGKMPKLIRQAKLLSRKYDVVVTNPPYMGSGGMDAKLSKYVKDNYPDSKSDLFAVFIEQCGAMIKPNGYQAMITQHAWMFLSSYEKLREKILQKMIVNMAHLGPRAFEEIGGEVVQTTSFVLRNELSNGYQGEYCRLIEPTTQDGKEELFLSKQNRRISKQENFAKIPGSPVAYWASEQIRNAFKSSSLYEKSVSPSQNVTGNNEKYVRKCWELEKQKIGEKSFWIFYCKGGGYRKWWGNLEDIIDWTPNARYVYKHGDGKHASQIINKKYWYKRGITWGLITSNKPSFRVMPEGATYDKGGSTLIVDDAIYNFSLGLLNSKVYVNIVSMLNPTLNYQVKDVRSMPLILKKQERINEIVNALISESKADWDFFETSWDFQTHPLLASSALDMAGLITEKQPTLAERYEQFKAVCEDRFDILKDNEEALNRIFIDIYGLQDELTPEVADYDITVHRVFDSNDDIPQSMYKKETDEDGKTKSKVSPYVLTKEDVMKSLLSYAVGCLFGRYSLDTPGLAYAGGEWDADTYQTFIPDNDNVVPITDEEYFDDDLSSFICAWLKKAFGRENFEANLEFLTDALGTRGTTSREKFRNYFLKNFYKDHCKTYQKRPIYWLFDSGKENGFKALVYLHRYDENTIGRVRADYLHRMERIYSNEVNRMQDVIDHSHSAHEVSVAEKRLEKMKKQIKECQDYDAKLGHLALDQIHLDLDDGVKINYRKAQTGRDGKFYEVLADSKAIMAKDALWHEYLTEWPHEQ